MAFRYEVKYLGLILVAMALLLVAIVFDAASLLDFPGEPIGLPFWRVLAFLAGGALFAGIAFVLLRPTALVLLPEGVQVNGMRSSKLVTWNDLVLAPPRIDEVQRAGEAACIMLASEDIEDGNIADRALRFYEAHPELRDELGNSRLVCERCVTLQAQGA